MFDATFPDREAVVLADLLDRHAREQPDKTFAVFADGREWTYHQTAVISWTVATGLLDRCGVGLGDVVAALLPNGPEALAAWFGTNCTGASFAPLNTAYRGAILEHALNLTRAPVLFVHAELLDRLDRLTLPHLRVLVVVGWAGGSDNGRFRQMSWTQLTHRTATGRPHLPQPIEPWHDMVVLMTSGTTGASKAVRRTYVQYSLYTDTTFSIVGVGAPDRFYVCGPMFHGGADTPIFSMLQLGASIAVSDGFSVSRFWEEVRATQSTVTWIHSSMSLFLSKQPPAPGDADNPLRLAMLAPMIPGSAEFARRFAIRLYMVYGMTEMPCVFSVMDPVDDSTLGPVADPGYEARIVDANDVEVPDGTPGELIVRHRLPWAVTPGYLHDAEATARVWRNGWFHSGDVFVRDAAGEYRLVDRVKDSIRRRGENVSAAEVETALLEHPDIVEAAVIGVASELEEDVLAYVSVRSGRRLPAEVIHAFLAQRLPYFAVPRYIVHLDTLPRNVALRPDKPAMRRLGVPSNAWDRESEGVTVTRERLSRTNSVSAPRSEG
jgi:crotonobetaine/carnitine-CoA ligase